jgi:hypothetical protein
MADETHIAPRRAPHLAAIFQKAYAQAVMIQGIDEQIDQMIEQRERLELEIHQIQSQINGEFERMLTAAKDARLKLRAQIAQAPPRNVEVEIAPNLKFANAIPMAARAAS